MYEVGISHCFMRKMHGQVKNFTLLILDPNEMGGACDAYGGRGEAYTEFGLGNLRERNN